MWSVLSVRCVGCEGVWLVSVMCEGELRCGVCYQ